MHGWTLLISIVIRWDIETLCLFSFLSESIHQSSHFCSIQDVEAAANTTCEEMEDKSMDMDPREARLKLNRSLFQDVDDK